MQWQWNIGLTRTYLRNAGKKSAGCWISCAAITFILHALIRRIVHCLFSTHPTYYRNSSVLSDSKHNHCHTPQKPDWLKHEIIRLKAVMPLAGCRTIADNKTCSELADADIFTSRTFSLGLLNLAATSTQRPRLALAEHQQGHGAASIRIQDQQNKHTGLRHGMDYSQATT